MLLPAACLVRGIGAGTVQQRQVPPDLRTGAFLSPLRVHPVTGEDYGPTSTRQFLDLMKQSTPFSQGIEKAASITVTNWDHYGVPESLFNASCFRPDGYPTMLPNFTTDWGSPQVVSVKATIGLGGNFVEEGEYLATWSGSGHILFQGDAALLKTSGNTAYVKVSPASGVVVRLVATDPSDPLHAISLVPVVHMQGSVAPTFHPQFLQSLRSATVLRFTGWQLIDAWDTEARSWAERATTTKQTQAGPMGVAIEYMVELANTLGADVWFSMPQTTEADAHSYARSFAELVKAQLNSTLRVYVEYGSCCLNGLAPGWNSQENAVQSLLAWNEWEAVFGEADSKRVVNLISSLQQIDKFGSDIGRIEAAAIDVAFGTLCNYGEAPCTDYKDIEAPEAYLGFTPRELIDKVMWPAMLKEESKVNAAMQTALHYGLEVVAFNALPLVSARSYGHRGTLSWALQCESCLSDKLGRRYGYEERQALANGSYILEENFVHLYEYEGLVAVNRVDPVNYWMMGSPEQAKARCSELANCRGFTYVKSGEWSCGIGNSFRSGGCATPGAAYFFNMGLVARGRKKPPTSCTAYTVADPSENCDPGNVDTYFKADDPAKREELLAREQQALSQCGTCQYAHTSHYYTYDVPTAGFTLTTLHAALPHLINKSAQEQQLENNMIDTIRLDDMVDVMLHYLDRLRQLGFGTVIGGPMYRGVRLCRTGGKACGIGSMMTHPDDSSPVLRAYSAYRGGRRPALARPAAAPAACAQPCVHGVCEGGICRCWARASGADCSVLEQAPRCDRKLAISLSGVSYWNRQWVFVDVFKHAGEWIPQEFTSYNWNTGVSLNFTKQGYPSALVVDQQAKALTLWSLERHYVSGWYTVLYDGNGVLDFSSDVTAVRPVAPGHIQVYVNLTTRDQAGLAVAVSHTYPDDPVRNIRVITPGFEDSYETSPFHPAFLASLKRYSVVRFMDWMHANVEGVPWQWEDRATPSYFSQASHKGVSLEHMVLLANELGASPWFSLPINATDDFIRKFARYAHENLRPDVEVYFEMGNEVWHPGFFGGQWAQQQGAGSSPPLSTLCWYAKRTGEMGAIVKAEIGSARRVIIHAGSQAVNEDATKQLLACEGIDGADVFGLGLYFDGHGALPDLTSATLEDVLNSYAAEVNHTLEMVRLHKAELAGTKYALVAYEAGPGGEGDGSGTDLAIQAHRHPRMRELVRSHLEALDMELQLITYFASCGKPSKYGSWGMIEAMDQPRKDAVKYLAVQDFLDAKNSCPAVSECAPLDGCNGNGICGSDNVCYCYRGYSGATCLDASFTDYVACGYRCNFDQGKCKVWEMFGNLRSWNCGCHEDYTGATCSRFDCPNGCNYRGHCIASGVCSCFRGFKGDSCEVDCGCDHHGQCNAQNECICDAGWRKKAIGRGCEWDCATADTLGCTGPGQSACADCRFGSCLNGRCRCWAGYTGAKCDTARSDLRPNLHAFGINVALSPSTFVDVMKTSQEWVSVWNADTFAGQFSYQGGSLLWENRQWQWGNGMEIAQTKDGYAARLGENQAIVSLALRDVCLHAPEGRYVVTYEGDGELDFGMDAKAASFQKGRIDIDFTPTCKRECWYDKKTYEAYCTDNGIPITIRQTNPANPIRDIRIIMPGFFATHEVEPFHPWFLKNLERFSFIRFMDWGKTNEDFWIPREAVPARWVRFTYLTTRGGGAARLADLMLRDAAGGTVPCTSAVPEICDGDPNTDWAPDVGTASVVVEVPEGSALSAYMWVTSGWARRVDPVSWVVEGSVDNATWTVLDGRSTAQLVTGYRRRIAAVDAPEERSWYPIRRPTDLLQWEDRFLPNHRSQAHSPVALEYQVLLANTLGSAPWVCVHHLASDDYVRKEAEFWLQHLRADVSVYVEHSNEVWNALFPQGRYATQRGTELGLTEAPACQTNPRHCARVRYNAWRSEQIFRIWTEVWGASRSRLKFVLSTQAVWADCTRDLLSGGARGADLLGITAYMGPDGGVDGSFSPLTPAEVIARFEAGAEGARSYIRAQKALAQEQGMGVAIYEGGVGLVEAGAIETGEATGAVTELLMATGRSPEFRPAVSKWLTVFREELGDQTSFGYFVDTGFWSKYGQWGMREYYDAATATSPAAAAVHAHIDALAGALPGCVKEGSGGRGLPPDSFMGPPAVKEPRAGDTLVAGKRYQLQWHSARLAPGTLEFHLWRGTSCTGQSAQLGQADARSGAFSMAVPEATAPGSDYFVELRPISGQAPSNYTGLFSIVPASQAPLDYMLYVENDVDLLSAFHRDCKKDKDWALQPHFKISTCVYSSAEGCRSYRTSRKSETLDGPPPWRHGSFKPLTDCTLHIVGLRQTMRLEGLTRGFDLSSPDTLARIVANVSQLPPGAVSISVAGATPGARRLSGSSVELEISISSDDGTVQNAALGLSTLSSNTAFLKAAADTLGESGIMVTTSDNVTATDGGFYLYDGSTTSGGPSGKCAMVQAKLLEKLHARGWAPVTCGEP